MSKQILHIGIDDTDSPKGMCTTFLAYKIINRLKKENVDFLDFPNLVRFNPNIPWKTRGNGAVGIKISTSNPGKIKNLVKKFVKQYSDVKNGANLLDRLIKDIVTESNCFDVERFVPLLQKYIRRSNPYIRPLLVGAIHS